MAEAVGQDKLAATKVAGMLRFSVSYAGYPRMAAHARLVPVIPSIHINTIAFGKGDVQKMHFTQSETLVARKGARFS